MRIEDAPPPGWYPDPQGGSRLRWWEGTDWSERFRSPPTPGVNLYVAPPRPEVRVPDIARPDPRFAGRPVTSDTQQIIDQVRAAARGEAERAAELFGIQARSVVRDITPLITEYSNRFVRWVKVFAVIAFVLVIAYAAFQIFAQASLFEWVGDRIDNISDNLNEGVGDPSRPVLVATPE